MNKRLNEILAKFNTSDNILKYTTHMWDFGINEKPFNTFEEFLILVKEEFETFEEELQEISPNIHSKMKKFLLSEHNEAWGIEKIKFGWSSPELKKYLESNSRPESYLLDEEYRKIVKNHSMDRFGDVKDIFKEEIELRTETKAIRRLFRANREGVRVKFENLEIFDKYEDVENLGKVIRNIFKSYAAAGIKMVLVKRTGPILELIPNEDKIITWDKVDIVTVANIEYGLTVKIKYC